MKKIVSIVMVLALSMIVFTSAAPKKKKKAFKGKITYAITYDSEELTDVQKASLPKDITVKVIGNMESVEMIQGPAVITQIERPDEFVKITLIEYGMKKGGITEIDSTVIDTNFKYTTTIDYSDDTKMFGDYKCNKASVTFTPKEGVEDAEELVLDIYYSSELGDASLNENGPYAGVPGRIVEFYVVVPQLITKFSATEIKKGGVSELEDFYFNSDYKEFETGEELMEYMQGE